MSRIPGRFPFRLHVFINSTNVPVEQDLFYMDIPVPDLEDCTIRSLSYVHSDELSVLRISMRLSSDLPYEGAINLNFSTVENIPENMAAWPETLGYPIGPSGRYRIPCRVAVNNVV